MADITWEQALQMFGASDLKVVGRKEVAEGAPTWHVKDSGGALVTGPHSGPPPPGTTDITAAPAYYTVSGYEGGSYDVPYEGEGGTDGVNGKVGNWGEFFALAYSTPWAYETEGGAQGTVDWAKIGVQFDGATMTNSPYANFVKQTTTILDPLKGGTGGNDKFSVPSLVAASDWLGQLDTWLTGRVDDMKVLLHGVGDGGDGGWHGKAADAFKTTVQPLRRQLFALHIGLDVANLQADLKASEDAMVSAVQKMYDAVEQWKAHQYYDPHKAYLAAIQQALSTANFKFIRRGGRHLEAASPQDDPGKPEFWGHVDTLAKQNWLSSLGALDRGAADAVATLGPSYLSLNGLLDGVTASLTTAGKNTGGPDGKPGDPNNKVPSLDDILKQLGGDPGAGKGGVSGVHVPGVDGPGFDGPGFAGGPGFGPDNGAGLGGSFTGGGGEVFGPDGAPVLGANGLPLFLPPGAQIRPDGSVVDRNGKPILGADGKPLTVPPNSRIGANTGGPGGHLFGLDGGAGRGGGWLTVPPGSTVKPDGTVIGPEGAPVLGPGGKPLTVPPGSTIGPDGSVRGPDGQLLGPDGGALPAGRLHVPPGSTITPDGSVIGPDGAPVLGAGGRPLEVPPGSHLGPDGSVFGPDGSVLGPDGQSLAVAPPVQRPETLSSFDGFGPDSGAAAVRPATSSGLPTFGGGGGGGGGGFGGADTGATLQGLVGSDGRLLADSGAATPGLVASAKGIGSEDVPGTGGRLPGAAPFAAEGSQLAGSEAGGMPFMPPMGGMGGGMGMGGGTAAGGSRRTWLVEDEDVWGTEVAATSGVIGRGEPPAGRPATTPRRQTRPRGAPSELTTAGPDRARDERVAGTAEEAGGRTAAATTDHGGGDG